MAKIIPIEEIEDGLILAEPIMNNFGQTMLGVGIELKVKHKRLLKTWNIEKVIIKTDDDDEDNDDISDELMEIAKEKFNNRCKWKPENKFEKVLFKIGIRNIIDELLKSQ